MFNGDLGWSLSGTVKSIRTVQGVSEINTQYIVYDMLRSGAYKPSFERLHVKPRKDGTFDVKAKAQNDFKAPDMEYTTSVFNANIQSTNYETRFNSALDVGADKIYREFLYR